MSAVRNCETAAIPSAHQPAKPLAPTDNTHPALPRPRLGTAMAGMGLLALLSLSLSHYPPKEVAAGTTPTPAQMTTPIQTLIERDRNLLAATAAERLDAAIDPLFADFHDRVPAFGEWAFAWRTGYRMLRDGMLTAITIPFSDPPRVEKIDSAWDELIAGKFDELVLHPAGGVPALRSAHERWLADMRPIVDAVLADTLRTVTLLHGETHALPPKEAQATPLTEKVHILDNIPDTTDPVKVNAARPLLSRFLIRPHVATAVAAAGAAIGNQGETWLGWTSQLGATITSYLMIDFILSQTGAGIYRPGLEADVHHVLENEQQNLRKTWLAEEQERIDARLAQIRPLLNGEGTTTPPPNSVPANAAPGTAHPAPGQ